MRFSIARLTCIMLLILLVLAPVAGAMNAQGQTVPDDAQPQLLIAGADTPTGDVSQAGDNSDIMYATDAVEPVAISTTASGIPGYDPSEWGVAMPVMPAEMMAYDPALAARVCDGISPAILCFPDICAADICCPSMPVVDMSVGNSVGSYAAPMIPGYWDNVDPSSLNTNMPMIPA